MPSFRKLPVNQSTYVIVDRGFFPTDKEYIELGVREGWLELFKMISTREGTEYQYRYPANY